MSDFPAHWLARREPVDATARSRVLAQRFAAALPQATARPLRLIDLGAGTGSNARALAPLVARDQDWLLVERDPALGAAQGESFARWAQHHGWHLTPHAAGMVVEGAGARWCFRSTALDLAGDWTPLAQHAADGVTAAALFDLVSAAWVARLAAWLAPRRLPLLAALTTDGRREWRPPDPADAMIAAGFARDQSRDKGLGRALGGAAAETAARSLAAAGFAIVEATSDWCLGAPGHALLGLLIDGEAAAARAADPAAATAIAHWAARRRAQAAAGVLTVAIGHRDLLALPAQI